MCITDLGIQQEGIITSIDATDSNVQRLMTMGLVEGAEITHLSSIGGTHEFRMMGAIIAFTQEQAQHFTVEPV
jgi:Fe2+ transport system protein FeoA